VVRRRRRHNKAAADQDGPDRPEGESLAENLSPRARRLIESGVIDPAAIVGSGKGGQVTSGDILLAARVIEKERSIARIEAAASVSTSSLGSETTVEPPEVEPSPWDAYNGTSEGLAEIALHGAEQSWGEAEALLSEGGALAGSADPPSLDESFLPPAAADAESADAPEPVTAEHEAFAAIPAASSDADGEWTPEPEATDVTGLPPVTEVEDLPEKVASPPVPTAGPISEPGLDAAADTSGPTFESAPTPVASTSYEPGAEAGGEPGPAAIPPGVEAVTGPAEREPVAAAPPVPDSPDPEPAAEPAPTGADAFVNFGTLEQVDPDSVWEEGAEDFAPWFLAHSEQIADVLGMDAGLRDARRYATKSASGVIGTDPDGGQVVVVSTARSVAADADLGRALGMVASSGASSIALISAEFREEQLRAIAWLNNQTRSGVKWYGVEMRVVRIGDSPAAMLFELVASPADPAS
jgi:hypothetical protein